MKFVKSIFFSILTVVSATIAVLMVAVAYSDRINPAEHPILGCAGMVFPFLLAANVAILVAWVIMKWRKAWIPLAALLLSYPAIRVYIPLHIRVEPPKGCIKVLSYNVDCFHYKNADGSKPSKRIIEYLEKEDADIVCIQEDIWKNGDEPDYERLYPYNDTIHFGNPKRPHINAMGVHSRYPILRKERIWYSSPGNGSTAFYLFVDGDTVLVVNNHLESTHLSEKDRRRYREIIQGDMESDNAREESRLLIDKLAHSMSVRAPQADAVHKYIRKHRNYPMIVCGDFNDTPISYVRRTIADGLTDCYVESGSGPGFSFQQKGFYVRIDQMMCSEHFQPYNCRIDKSVRSSDHYPIVCFFERTDL